MPFGPPEIQAFASGLPLSLLHALVGLGVLIAGAAVYALLTPYKDVQLIREGNPAAALAFGGALVSLAIPIAASISASVTTLDVALWAVAITVVQLAAFRLVDLGLKGLPQRVQEGEVPAAALLAGAKLAVSLILAAAVAG